MIPRMTALAIKEAARNGDLDTLNALLNQQETLLADLSTAEAREACQALAEAEEAIRAQMEDLRRELGSIHSKRRGARQYKIAA